jgi:hypothetical protein
VQWRQLNGDENKITLEEYADITIGSPDYCNDLITINTSDINTQEWDDWITTYTGALDLDIGNDWSFDNRLGADEINLTAGGGEMLRCSPRWILCSRGTCRSRC